LFEPKPTAETNGEVLAGLNAAPTASRVIARIGPLFGMLAANTAASAPGVAFDATSPAKYEAR
jgi:cell division protein FtsI (penicillin-binding protein 3)